MDILENIKKRPHHEKKKIAYIVAGIITFVILVFWLLALAGGINQSQKEENGQPAQSIIGGVSDLVSGVVEDFPTTKRPADDENSPAGESQDMAL